MEPESLVRLINSGNASTIEIEWMKLVESDSIRAEDLLGYQCVLTELVNIRRQAQAETLAWAAIEAIIVRDTPRHALQVAGAFLMAIGESPELRKQVTGLYRTAYPDYEGLDALLTEAGLPVGRPVRRALRTLDVALAVGPGDFLVSRDDDEAARVDEVDRSTWQFTVTNAEGTQPLGVVNLADRYQPAPATDLRVLRSFSPKDFAARISNDPASIVIELCRRHGNKLDGDRLESLLVPSIIAESDWKKWFTRARAALKELPNVRVEGRTPYLITYEEAPRTCEGELLDEFRSRRDASGQIAALDRYLRECKARKQAYSVESLRDCFEKLCTHAKSVKPPTALDAGLLWLAARKIGELIGLDGAGQNAVAWFKSLPDPVVVFRQVEDASLLELAFKSFVEARPQTWETEVLSLFPLLPLPMCEGAAARLVEAGRTVADFAPVVEKILATPIPHFEALLWLWDGRAEGQRLTGNVTRLALLARILRTLEDCRRTDHLPKDLVKNISQKARNVLAARKHERFAQCIDDMDAGMANAVRGQLRRLESLGRSVRDDLLNLLRVRFPIAESTAAAKPLWAREDVLFVTERGMAKKNSEIEHHVNVKMRENAQAIGRAAEHGDLSENSEYKFALEERDLLRARLAQMNSELAMAKVISAQEVATGEVGIGTRVVFRRVEDGQPYEMTFVGPWEADGNKKWFNYRAPLSQEVMGKRVGDQLEFNHTGLSGIYEIVAIHNALADPTGHLPAESANTENATEEVQQGVS